MDRGRRAMMRGLRRHCKIEKLKSEMVTLMEASRFIKGHVTHVTVISGEEQCV